MPPKRGIVKSGNAGNSAKSGKPPATVSASPEEKPLFPPGSKYPLSLLHERCQKNGWEKPIVDTRRQGDGYSFVVTLSRMNRKTSERESVRMEPHPPYVLPSALEARHWGATYALYRFCNGIQLNRVLPPGPREYWNQLAAEHKTAPEHQKWMYEADPFAARKAVEERQEKAAKKKEQASRGEGNSVGSHGSSEFAHAPEAKMAASLREFVEDAVKKGIAKYPEAAEPEAVRLAPEDTVRLATDLELLGFTQVQARRAVKAISESSALTASLLGRLPPLQACIEYLILEVPECDLPRRFLPSVNSSNPFITATHSGTDDLKKRWIEEKAVKECGWPEHVVRECTSDLRLVKDWSKLIFALDCRLIGEDWEDAEKVLPLETETIEEDEIDALGGRAGTNGELVIPLPTAPLELHIIVGERRVVSIGGSYPPMYITSPTVAAYVRLHILSRLIHSFKSDSLRDPEESVIMAAMRLVEEEWALIQDDGPPPLSEVLQHLLPRSAPVLVDGAATIQETQTATRSAEPRIRTPRRDDRSDVQVKEEFEQVTRRSEFAKMLTARERLPAYKSRNAFLDLLRSHRCVVVVGETGCGKTTQLPQFVLDDLILSGHGSRASIVVTQPRRLSALGVAARVSAERLDDGSVGYAIRGESKQGPRTKILFCTTGVVLRRLGSGDKLDDVTHVIVDEVHERSVDGDFLLLELRELLKTHRKLKVILMSATINHEVFVKYFNNAPLLTIPGFTHPVEDLYLEDYLPRLEYRPSNGRSSRKIKGGVNQDADDAELDEDIQAAIRAIMRSESFDYDLIVATVNYVVSTAPKIGGILIFLSGVQEIRQCMEKLRGIPHTQVLPLHANLSSDEQRLVFAPATGWKIIVSTNVAETSVTIDDVIYVIDGGKVKETHYDPDAGLTKLTEQWITRAAARQRRGRAGRTQPGVCYKLYTRAQENRMAPFPVPEIRRVPLESIALTLKVVHNDVKSFLSQAIDPPDTSAVDKALAVLEELGATGPNGELTALGRHMAMLPMDLRLGKMLILATVFRCLNPILTVAACLSSKPLFVSPIDKREEASQARAKFATGNSDLLTDANAYDECIALREKGASHSAIRAFCEENFISASTIRDITSLRLDFFSALTQLGFLPPLSKPSAPGLNANAPNTNLVKAVILGGLWPRVARVHLPRSAIKFDRVQAGTVQRENSAREFRMYDVRSGRGQRVFLHPASVLFSATTWRSPFLAYFQKQMTSKVFLRDATEVPIYALLLFGGPVSVNPIAGGLTVGTNDCLIKLKAWPRIGVLVNHLRRLLDARLARCIEDGTILDSAGASGEDPVLHAIQALLLNDGLTN
ncbi:P-loop containing nucleoside triphosphate hydrolase protein [Trametes punicea]|nr:P-loop containing nucleoside triphosphate hydrolase protein [Trametes punicea]